MTNRITQYDAARWLAFLVEQRLIDHGEPVIATHESMRKHPDVCIFEDNDESREDT